MFATMIVTTDGEIELETKEKVYVKNEGNLICIHEFNSESYGFSDDTKVAVSENYLKYIIANKEMETEITEESITIDEEEIEDYIYNKLKYESTTPVKSFVRQVLELEQEYLEDKGIITKQ